MESRPTWELDTKKLWRSYGTLLEWNALISRIEQEAEKRGFEKGLNGYGIAVQEARADERRKVLELIEHSRGGRLWNPEAEQAYQDALTNIQRKVEARTGSKSEGV